MTAVERPDAPAHDRAWRAEKRTIAVRGVRRPLRLVQFPGGWLASVDTESGPTLGADRSPYLAAHRALESLGIDLAEVMSLVGPVRRG